MDSFLWMPPGWFWRISSAFSKVFKLASGGVASWQNILEEFAHLEAWQSCPPGAHAARRKLSEEHILLSVSLGGLHFFSSFRRGANSKRAWECRLRQTPWSQLEGRCRSKRNPPQVCLSCDQEYSAMCLFWDRVSSKAFPITECSVCVRLFLFCFSLMDFPCVQWYERTMPDHRQFCCEHQCDTCRTLQCGTLFVSSTFGR